MGKDTLIEWASHTANPWWGCTEVHAGCDNCYARVFARAKGKAAAWEGVRFATKAIWSNLLKWQKAAKSGGEVHRVFTGSMMDIFEKSMQVSDWNGNLTGLTTGDLRDRYFNEIVPATPDLLHLLLTKRPGNIPKMVPASWLENWPANVMTGTSPVDQETADTLIPQLLRSDGRHFLSVEPLLGPIDLTSLGVGSDYVWTDALNGISERSGLSRETFDPLDWVIVGGESGHGARPFGVSWARSIRDQCKAAGVAFFMKQVGSCPVVGSFALADGWGDGTRTINDPKVPGYLRLKLKDGHGGDWDEWPEDLRVREMPTTIGAAS